MEGEGIILLTFLVEKMSSTNSTVRDRIKDLIIKVCSNEAFYPSKASFRQIMNGVQNKNAKIKKECLEIAAILIDDIKEELFTSKDVKIIVNEVDSHDKFTRANALECCVSIYKLIGDNLWKMAGKNINQKVKDLINSKISNVPAPKSSVEKSSIKQSKPQKATTSGSKVNTMKAPKKILKLQPPSKITEKEPPKAIQKPKTVSQSRPLVSNVSKPTTAQPKSFNKSLKKFVRKGK